MLAQTAMGILVGSDTQAEAAPDKSEPEICLLHVSIW